MTTETTAAESALPDVFEFAKWQLTANHNPEPMRKLVERLEQTRTGRQLVLGRRLLDAQQAAENGRP